MTYLDKQYELLRAEIMQNISESHTLLTTTYVSVGAMLAYFFVNLESLALLFDPPWLFVPVFVIFNVFFARLRVLYRSNLYISAYMEVFLEPDLEGIKWETRHYNIDRKKDFLNSSYAPNLLVMSTIYILFIYTLIANYSLTNSFAGIFNTVLYTICFFIARDCYSHDTRKEFVDRWRRIKVNEEK
jgi:hypothetical protein